MRKIAYLLTLVSLLGTFFLVGMDVSAKSGFKDVNTGHWAKKDIEFLADKKIINGYPDGRFGPNDRIRRVDAAAMIVRALDLDTTNRPNPGFRDVSKQSYGYELIATVADEQLFNGTNGNFLPNQSLTRAEMAAILARAYELDGKRVKVTFKDVTTKFWGYSAIQALVANNITTGYDDKTFRPNQPTTRAEFATFMARVLNEASDGLQPTNPQLPDEKKDQEADVIDDTFRVIDIY